MEKTETNFWDKVKIGDATKLESGVAVFPITGPPLKLPSAAVLAFAPRAFAGEDAKARMNFLFKMDKTNQSF